MTQVIVHAGFHKTGTTGLQDFLSDNKALLAPHLRYFGKADFLAAGAHARTYAQRRFPWRLWLYRRALRRFLAPLPPGGTIVLSRETFSGGMPGHRRFGGRLITGYSDAAHALAKVILQELRRKFGPDVAITFFYTTRARDPWIASVHGHLLRSIRLRDDLQTFRARLSGVADPTEEAARMAGALAPIPVVTAALEDYTAHREGPAAALLDLIGVPENLRARLTPARHGNRGQSADLRAAFLALNRTRLSKSALKAAKQDLLQPECQTPSSPRTRTVSDA